MALYPKETTIDEKEMASGAEEIALDANGTATSAKEILPYYNSKAAYHGERLLCNSAEATDAKEMAADEMEIPVTVV